jgi:signal peptidase II
VSAYWRGWALALALCAAVVAFDQGAKAAADAAVIRGDKIDLALGFELTNVRNRGIAFGLFDDGRGTVIVLTVLALVAVAVWLTRNAAQPGVWLAAGLLGGGALGNLIDRVHDDAVLDFIDPPLWPAFNVADIAITAGVATLLVLYWRDAEPADAGRRNEGRDRLPG